MPPKVDFDDFTDTYSETLHAQTSFFSSDDSYFARSKVEIVRRLVHSEPRRVLEYGCGIGRNLPFIVKEFPAALVMGSDISQKSIEIARRQYPEIHFWQEGQPGGEEGGFDLIIVAGVFHHIPPRDRLEAAATLFRRLAPGGDVVVFEHNPFNPVTRHLVAICPYDEDAILLRPSELQRHLRGAGLQIAGQKFSLFVPPRFHRLLKYERLIGWLPLGGQYWVHARRT